MTAALPILTLIVAALTAALMVPLINRVAVTKKLLDYPDGERHHHSRPVPRLGGVAVFVGLLVGVALNSLLSPSVYAPQWSQPINLAVLAASGILFGIGLLDDLRGVSPALKLIGQSAAAAIVISFGFRVEQIAFVPGYEFSLGVFSVPVTLLWLVGVSNAFNLVDGLDGLAGGVGVIALISICAAALALVGSVPAQSMALAGALLGFLYWNRPPARIFLGDSGSLVVGFLLAFLSVRGSTTPDGVLYALVPIFALSYLLLDTGISMLRRWLRGAPLSRADGRHIHHQLLALGLSPARAAMVILAKASFIALLGLCVTFVPPGMTVAITSIGVAILLAVFIYGVRWLDYHEFLEAGASFASGVRKARSAIQDRIVARDVASLLRSAKTLDEMNAIVRSWAPVFRFVHMEITHENAPRAASVRAPDHIGSATWLLEYPLVAEATGGFGPPRSGESDPVLAIWCAVTATTGRSVSAERVAQILAPVIARGLAQIAARGEIIPEVRTRRASGAFAAKRRPSSEHRRIADAQL